MRPIRLEIRGFTAFREPQVVEFDGLDLFAITGPTGSGKSSILDALTFALYGRAERVGDGVRQLVSLGQPRAAVVLEFEAASERYRVARSVTADAKSKILLERADPATETGWRQAGEGADRVRDADATIARLVGLDYAGFTRAVLLPQGRFAEFLAGDAKTRRKILADLLDLGLFERMAVKAGELARGLGGDVNARTGVLEAEYGEATAEGLEVARLEHEAAAAIAARLAAARDRVGALVARAATIGREQDELEKVREATVHGAAAARSQGEVVARLSAAIHDAEAGRQTASEAAEREAQAAAAAAGGLAEAEAVRGDAATLAAQLERARSLAAGREALDERRRELTELAAAIEPAQLAATTAGAAALDAGARETEAVDAERRAAEALEAARSEDRVAAVSRGLAVGDPCPVCGRPLESTPDHHRAPALDAAITTLELARAAAAEASSACRTAVRAAAEASGFLDRERDRLTRAESALADEERRLDEAAGALQAELGPLEARDPLTELERRAAELRGLTAELETRRAAAAAADEALRSVDRLLAEARAELATERARLEAIPVDDLVQRAAALGVRPKARSRRPRGTAAPERAASDEAASAVANRLERLGTACAAAITAHAEAGQRVVAEAWGAIGDLVPISDDLDAVVKRIEAAHASAIGSAAVAADRVAELERKIGRREELEAEIDTLRERGARLKQLALELRQDRIVAFLQEEALESLAAAGSLHLEELSSGRYRLEVVDDEFLVVDTWNGEDRRSVKTLSGGESFLASLALALALGEQVPSLAVDARSRVTGLFLDEGFGTLDEETLQVVIGAVEILGGEDRMVGVVTHVAELAERLPARIVVEKSPRGSRILRV